MPVARALRAKRWVKADLLRRFERGGCCYASRRVRRGQGAAHTNGTVARIEVPEGGCPICCPDKRISDLVRAARFVFVALDLDGLRGGEINSLLQLGPTRRPG